MAIVTTIIEPDPVVLGWSGIGDTMREVSKFPRAEVRFYDKQTMALAGAGDNQAFYTNLVLPSGYAYVLDTIRVLFQGVGGANPQNWTALGGAFANAQGPIKEYEIPIHADPYLYANTAGHNGVIWETQDPPKTILIPRGDEKCVGFMSAYNTVAADAQYSCTTFGRFLMYDINQAFDNEVNTPVLTR